MGKRLSTKYTDGNVVIVDKYQDEHHLRGFGTAVSRIIDEYPKVEEYRETIEKKNEIIETLTNDNERFRERFMLDNTNVSVQQDRACDYLDRDSKGKLFCRHPNPPIKTRDLTPKACMLCQKERRRKSQATQKKEEDDINRFHEQTKRNIHRSAERLNETIRQEKQRAKEIYCPDGLYVPLTKCEERCPPYKKLGCHQFKREQQLI